MFDYWNRDGEPTPVRPVTPPMPVTIDLGTAIARTPRSRDGVPMRVRAEGLHLTGTVPGTLHAWAHTTDGDWLGYVTLTAQSGNGNGNLHIEQWIPARAITPEN